jgi:transcriptional regulator with PAS, ATPase and Fis domain
MTEMIEMIGESPAMNVVRSLVERVAPTDATVLISGESGAGKEPVAQSIHRQSERCAGPFIAVNCGAIPATLIEAELFGYERGSFTGAARSHEGVFERACGGTLFLDEVTEMPNEMQTRLLRLLETRRFFRVGGSLEIDTDVRVIAATNRCPIRAAQSGVLREDLLYRLAVFPIVLPPLRERGDDVLLLARYFLDSLNDRSGTRKRLTAAALDVLVRHSWPGNVRELKNAIERAFILSDDALNLEFLPVRDATADETIAANGVSLPLGTTLAQAERQVIEATLAHWNGNKSRSAQALGCSLKTLYNKLAQYQREPAEAVG